MWGGGGGHYLKFFFFFLYGWVMWFSHGWKICHVRHGKFVGHGVPSIYLFLIVIKKWKIVSKNKQKCENWSNLSNFFFPTLKILELMHNELYAHVLYQWSYSMERVSHHPCHNINVCKWNVELWASMHFFFSWFLGGPHCILNIPRIGRSMDRHYWIWILNIA